LRALSRERIPVLRMDRVYIMGGTLALVGGLLLARGIRILWKGEASLADALPVFGLLGKLFLSGFQLKGGWARVASIPIFLLSLTALAGGGSLIALKYFRPQELEGVMLAAAAKLAKDNPSDGDKKAVAGETVGQMKDLLAGLKTSSQARADAAVSVPEADLGPIPVSHPMGNDFRKFIETPGKLSVVVLEVPQDETAVKLREMIERVGRRFSNVAQVACFDLDTWTELGEDQGVTQVPDVRFYRDGKKVDGFVGVPAKDVVLLEKFVRHSQGLTGESPATVASISPQASASPYPPAPNVRDLTERQLDEFIQQPERLVVLVHGAEWCGFSKKINLELAKLSEELGGVMKVGRLDVDRASQRFNESHRIKTIPMVEFYREGKRVARFDGYPPPEVMQATVLEHTRDLPSPREALPAAPRSTNEPAVQPMKKGWMPAGMEKR